jgi:hypothetical protein
MYIHIYTYIYIYIYICKQYNYNNIVTYINISTLPVSNVCIISKTFPGFTSTVVVTTLDEKNKSTAYMYDNII